MSIKVLSESLDKTPVRSKTYVVTTARDINEHLVASYNKMKSLTEQLKEVQSQWKSLQQDLEGVTFAKYVTNGTLREQFQKAVDDLKLEYEDAKTTYLHYKDLKNKMLTESDDSEIEFDYEEDRPLSIEIDSEEEPADTIVDYEDADDFIAELTSIVDSGSAEDTLDFLFTELVPDAGIADTLVGELVRALMHILFEYKITTYTFYQDRGIASCGGAAQFLADNGYEDDIMSLILKDTFNYYKDVLEISKHIARDILSDPKLLSKPNNVDSETYSNTKIIAASPTFKYTVHIPYSMILSMESNNLKYSEILDYVKSKLQLRDGIQLVDIYNDNTAVELDGITKTEFERISNIIESDKSFWKDFKSVPKDSSSTENPEVEDVIDNYSDEVEVTEELEANNISLTEDKDEDLDRFLSLHEDPANYESNPSGFEKLYNLFDSYGFSSTEDVDICFKNLSEEDKILALQFIRRK